MILTVVGYLLLVLSGLALCLFCWLGYVCVTRASRPSERLAQDTFVGHAADDMTPPVGAARR